MDKSVPEQPSANLETVNISPTPNTQPKCAILRYTPKELQLRKKKNLDQLTKEELVERVIQLEAHNEQLKNLLKNHLQGKRKPQYRKKPFNFDTCTFRRIALQFYYLGWNYDGYATQEESANTIEDHLMSALIKTCLIKDRQSCNYHRCGRTDKGVSSFGQVVSLTIRSKLAAHNLDCVANELDYCKMLNQCLPSDIQCVAWCPVSEDFSARFNCTQRTYKYFFPQGRLNISKMKSACEQFRGTHDFRNFCKMDVGHGVVDFTRTIRHIDIRQLSNDGPHSMHELVIVSKGFLWHQIRFMASVLFLIGDGKESANIITQLLEVNTQPVRPQYPLANHVPLNLFECAYDETASNWQVNEANILCCVKKLQAFWSAHAIQATMIREMVNGLCARVVSWSGEATVTSQNEMLLAECSRKQYIPLMTRPTCHSLEGKIEHFAKRKKIHIVTQEPGDANS